MEPDKMEMFSGNIIVLQLILNYLILFLFMKKIKLCLCNVYNRYSINQAGHTGDKTVRGCKNFLELKSLRVSPER